MPYSIQSETGPEGRFIVLSGDAALSAASELGEMVRTAVADGENVVTVDLAGATLIDSRTISVLVEWTESLASAGGRLQVICDDPNILRLLKRIGLDRALTLSLIHI